MLQRSLSLLLGAVVLGVLAAALALRLRAGTPIAELAAGGLHVCLAGLVWLGVPLVLALQRPADVAVRWFMLAGLGHALALMIVAVAPWSLGPAWAMLATASWALGALALVGLVVSIDAVARRAALGALLGAPLVLALASGPALPRSVALVAGGAVVAAAAALALRQRAVEAVARHQGVWLTAGLGLHAAVVVVAALAASWTPRAAWLVDAGLVVSVVAPVACALALQRARLLEASRDLVEVTAGVVTAGVALGVTLRVSGLWASLPPERALALTLLLGLGLGLVALRARPALVRWLRPRVFPVQSAQAEALRAVLASVQMPSPAALAHACARRIPEIAGAAHARLWWSERPGELNTVDPSGALHRAHVAAPGRLWALLTAFGAPMRREDAAGVAFDAAEQRWLDTAAPEARVYVPWTHEGALVGVLALSTLPSEAQSERLDALRALSLTGAPRLAAWVGVAAAESQGALRERVALLQAAEARSATARQHTAALQRVGGYLRGVAAQGPDISGECGRALARTEEMLSALATAIEPRRARPVAVRPVVEDALLYLAPLTARAQVQVVVATSLDDLAVQAEADALLLLMIDALEEALTSLATWEGPRLVELARRPLERNGRIGVLVRDTGPPRVLSRAPRLERLLAHLLATRAAEVPPEGGHALLLTLPWAPPPTS